MTDVQKNEEAFKLLTFNGLKRTFYARLNDYFKTLNDQITENDWRLDDQALVLAKVELSLAIEEVRQLKAEHEHSTWTIKSPALDVGSATIYGDDMVCLEMCGHVTDARTEKPDVTKKAICERVALLYRSNEQSIFQNICLSVQSNVNNFFHFHINSISVSNLILIFVLLKPRITFQFVRWTCLAPGSSQSLFFNCFSNRESQLRLKFLF